MHGGLTYDMKYDNCIPKIGTKYWIQWSKKANPAWAIWKLMIDGKARTMERMNAKVRTLVPKQERDARLAIFNASIPKTGGATGRALSTPVPNESGDEGAVKAELRAESAEAGEVLPGTPSRLDTDSAEATQDETEFVAESPVDDRSPGSNNGGGRASDAATEDDLSLGAEARLAIFNASIPKTGRATGRALSTPVPNESGDEGAVKAELRAESAEAGEVLPGTPSRLDTDSAEATQDETEFVAESPVDDRSPGSNNGGGRASDAATEDDLSLGAEEKLFLGQKVGSSDGSVAVDIAPTDSEYEGSEYENGGSEDDDEGSDDDGSEVEGTEDARHSS